MNKSCLSLIAIAVFVIVAVCGFVGYKVLKLNASESKKYVDETIPLIVTNWDKDALIKRRKPRAQPKKPPRMTISPNSSRNLNRNLAHS